MYVQDKEDVLQNITSPNLILLQSIMQRDQ